MANLGVLISGAGAARSACPPGPVVRAWVLPDRTVAAIV